MVVWKTWPQLKNVGFLDVQKPAKYDDFVIYVLAQVKWLYCPTAPESAKPRGDEFRSRFARIPCANRDGRRMGQLGQRVRTELGCRKKRSISVTQFGRNCEISTSEGRSIQIGELGQTLHITSLSVVATWVSGK